MTSLALEVKRFRDWAQHHPRDFGEWETDYADWPALRAAADQALAAESLGDDEVDLLLYALARDNECESILGMLQEHTVNGLRVARQRSTALTLMLGGRWRYSLAARTATSLEGCSVVSSVTRMSTFAVVRCLPPQSAIPLSPRT